MKCFKAYYWHYATWHILMYNSFPVWMWLYIIYSKFNQRPCCRLCFWMSSGIRTNVWEWCCTVKCSRASTCLSGVSHTSESTLLFKDWNLCISNILVIQRLMRCPLPRSTVSGNIQLSYRHNHSFKRLISPKSFNSPFQKSIVTLIQILSFTTVDSLVRILF